MYYEINVLYDGTHYFATAPRSLTDAESASYLIEHFRRIFPESEGYKVMCSVVTTISEETGF